MASYQELLASLAPRKDSRKSLDKFLSILLSQNRQDCGTSPFRATVTREILCNVCQQKSKQVPSDVIKGRGCPVCAGVSQPASEAKYRAALLKQNRVDLSAEPYCASRKRKILCNECNKESEQKATAVANGAGCPICSRRKVALGTILKAEERDLIGSRFGKLVVLSILTTPGRDRWLCMCDCGNLTRAATSDLLRGNNRSCGCTKSLPQEEIASFVESLGFKVRRNDRESIAPLELDIFLPEKGVAIEYCGLHWHGQILNGALARTKHYDKYKECQRIGVRLFTVFEDEWLNRESAVKNFLKASLGVRTENIGARECELHRGKNVDAFVEANHILGNARSNVTYSLEHKSKTVAAMTFKRERDRWNLIRFCIGEVGVPGAASRLLKAFLSDHPGVKLISFSDNRWSAGDLYRTLGFVRDGEVPPSYTYFSVSGKKKNRHHKFGFRKKQLSTRLDADGLTEWQMAQALGYDRIWDCGLIRWRLQ